MKSWKVWPTAGSSDYGREMTERPEHGLFLHLTRDMHYAVMGERVHSLR